MRKTFKRIYCMLLAVIALVSSLGIMNVQASTKSGAKTGTIAGVIYSEEEIPVTGREDEIQVLQTTLNNTNKYRVNVLVEFTFYDEDGKKIKDSSFLNDKLLKNVVGLKPNSSETIGMSLIRTGSDLTDPDFLEYSDYKITYHVLKESLTVNKKKKGAKDGVNFKASSIDIDLKLTSETEDQNIYQTQICVAFHNTNNYPVCIRGEYIYYEKNSKKSSGKTSGKVAGSGDIALCLFPNEKYIGGVVLENWISNYKMTYTVQKISKEQMADIASNDWDVGATYSKFQLKKKLKMGKKYCSSDKVYHVESCTISGDEFTFDLKFDKQFTYEEDTFYGIQVNAYDRQGYPLGTWRKYRGFDSLQTGDTRQLTVIVDGFDRKEIGSFDIILYNGSVQKL